MRIKRDEAPHAREDRASVGVGSQFRVSADKFHVVICQRKGNKLRLEIFSPFFSSSLFGGMSYEFCSIVNIRDRNFIPYLALNFEWWISTLSQEFALEELT